MNVNTDANVNMNINNALMKEYFHITENMNIDAFQKKCDSVIFTFYQEDFESYLYKRFLELFFLKHNINIDMKNNFILTDTIKSLFECFIDTTDIQKYLKENLKNIYNKYSITYEYISKYIFYENVKESIDGTIFDNINRLVHHFLKSTYCMDVIANNILKTCKTNFTLNKDHVPIRYFGRLSTAEEQLEQYMQFEYKDCEIEKIDDYSFICYVPSNNNNDEEEKVKVSISIGLKK